MSEVLVDTTVWIDFFNGRPQKHVGALRQLIENDEDLCVSGVILAEVLQGIRSDADYRKTRDYLTASRISPLNASKSPNRFFTTSKSVSSVHRTVSSQFCSRS